VALELGCCCYYLQYLQLLSKERCEDCAVVVAVGIESFDYCWHCNTGADDCDSTRA